ncbi:MAG: WYL domain-containing protein [Bacteroidales bacterium]|nr:WYL domain-containing protein [Bacteroidales bacterium]MCF8327835.1 WYL domain-containing protein [Bacteroidales bacterium]
MRKTGNAIVRYQTLDRCLRNPGRKYFMEDLIAACNEALRDINSNSAGVKRRQVFEDIRFMEDTHGYQAPIERLKEGRRTYYRYADMGFSINKQPLNQQEAEQLRETLMTLERFHGLPQFDWIAEIKTRLEQSFLMDRQEPIIGFWKNPYLTGREFIGELFDAINNRQVLKIVYRPFKASCKQEMIIHPLYLKEYNNRWFLLGWNEAEQNISNLALDRIQELKHYNSEYRANEQIDFNEYFEDVVGVTVPQDSPVQHIRLKVDAELWPYIKTKPLHGSQKTVKAEPDCCIISLDVIPNFELEALLLSFGDQLEVLEPNSFRNKIKERIQRAKQKYL